MSVAALIALAVLLGAAALWELAGSRGEELGRSIARRRCGAQRRARTDAGRRRAVASRAPAPASAPDWPRGFRSQPCWPGRLAGSRRAPCSPWRWPRRCPRGWRSSCAFALPAAGFLTPEALLERAARRRRARVGAALPDALDLLAVGTAAGRSPGQGARRDLDRRKRAAGLRAGGRGGGDPVRRAAARSDRRSSRTRAGLGARGPGVGARALPPVRLAARRPAP